MNKVEKMWLKVIEIRQLLTLTDKKKYGNQNYMFSLLHNFELP